MSLKGVGCGFVPLVTIFPSAGAGNPPGMTSSSTTGGRSRDSPPDKYCWFKIYSSFGFMGDWGRDGDDGDGEWPGASFTSFSGTPGGRPCSFGTKPVRRFRLCKLRWRLKIPERAPAAEVGGIRVWTDAPVSVEITDDFSGSVLGGKFGIAATW